MPRNFSPAERSSVKTATEEMPYVYETAYSGPGLIVVCAAGDEKIRNWSGLVQTYGWYVSQYIKDESGDIFVLMPITEVPE